MRLSEIDLLLAELATVVSERRVIPEPVGVQMVDHVEGMCRWPLDDHGLLCGAECEKPMDPDRRAPYCKGHAQRAYRRIIIP